MLFFTGQIAKSCLHVFVYMAITAGLIACGFQLRGAIDLSADIAPVYIEQKSVIELAREIKNLLATNNIKVVKKAAAAKTQLVLLNENKAQRILSVDSSGRAKEYRLSYTVNFVIAIEGADDVSDSLSVSRSLLFDPDAVLAVTNEAEILYKDMRRDVARLILLKLQALSRKKAVQADSPVQADSISRP